MSRRKVDLSELYDLLKSRNDSYVLCFDVRNLMQINENYGREAGDKAILECLRRIDSLTDDSCILFRIGGDEFALVTGLTNPQEAEQLARKILALNGTPILHNGTEIPVGMRVGGTKITGSNVRHHELFTDLNQAIIAAARGNTECYIQ